MQSLPTKDYLIMKLSKPQQQVSDNPNRFRVVSAGRRFGKSILSLNELAKYARQPGSRCLYVAPTYRQAKTVMWDELKAQMIDKRWARKINESDLQIRLVNDSTITLRSTDNYDALRGGKYDFIVLDECADMAPEAWTQVLRPTLSDTQGDALFIGSPKGRNWFYDIWLLGAELEDWHSFQFTTLDGGWVTESEIEAARRDLDERTFEQEYLAQFVNYSGVIFYAFDTENIDAWPGFANERTPLFIGMDFNNSPMSAVIATKTVDTLHIFDEIEIWGSNTNEMVEEIRNRYGYMRQMTVMPDASGMRKTTNSGGVSDHIILQNAGFRLSADATNPSVADSIASVNAMLCNSDGQRRLKIDPKCRSLINSITKWCYKPDTRVPDKTSGHDHMADALRYVTHRLFPLKQTQFETRIGTKHRHTGARPR